MQLCQERTAELSALVNEFILREQASRDAFLVPPCWQSTQRAQGPPRPPRNPSRARRPPPCALRPAGRTNTLLSQHLPPKVVEIVCCKLTPLQLALYCHFLESKVGAGAAEHASLLRE